MKKFISILLAGCTYQTPAVPGNGQIKTEAPSEVIVKYRDTADRNTIRAGCKFKQLTTDTDILSLSTLPSHPDIEYAEYNGTFSIAGTPNDPGMGYQWGLNNTGQFIPEGYGTAGSGEYDADVDMVEAWDNSISSINSNVYVVVIDEGIDYTHEDLQGAIINPLEDINNDGVITSEDYDGLDNDGNGFADDVYGWDFLNNDNTVYDPDPVWKVDSHGTHVAGIIGARSNNNLGVAGVNGKVKIISAKFLQGFGSFSDAVRAIDYTVDLKSRGVNIVAINASWGGYYRSQAVLDAVLRAEKAGILFIAAAGNSGFDISVYPFYPAGFNTGNMIAVASFNKFGALSTFSNFGSIVDLAAPGEDILSTLPFNCYDFWSGTSMAAPHVTGLVSLLEASNPSWGPQELKHRLLSAATPWGATVHGAVNAYRTVTGKSTDPQ